MSQQLVSADCRRKGGFLQPAEVKRKLSTRLEITIERQMCKTTRLVLLALENDELGDEEMEEILQTYSVDGETDKKRERQSEGVKRRERWQLIIFITETSRQVEPKPLMNSSLTESHRSLNLNQDLRNYIRHIMTCV